jgi:exosortase D (VPLPA-CTERM-specific)
MRTTTYSGTCWSRIGLRQTERFAYSRIQLAMADSVQVAPLAVRKQSGLFLGLALWQGVALLLLIVWLHASILLGLYEQSTHDKDFGYIPIVPIFSLFVLWQNRQKLKAVKTAPSWTGNPIIMLAMMVLVLGNLGAEVFSSRVSLLFLLAGLIVLFRGWPFFRAVLFPWAFLILMIPIPKIILQNITFPLQMLASKVSTALLRLLQVPVYREGNIINLPVMTLQVAEACSGLRSLLSLITLAIMYGYLLENRKWVRVVLAFSAVPIAVAANGFRIFGTGLIAQQWGRDKAEGFLHTFEGWLVFVVSLMMLFAVHGIIARIWKENPKPKFEKDDPSVTPGKDDQGQLQPSPVNFGVAILLLLATAIWLQVRSHAEVLPPREPLSSMPQNLGGWVGQDYSLDQQTLDILGPGEFLTRDYSNPGNGQTTAEIFIAYYASQRVAETPHSPDHCLFGAGFVPSQRQIVQLPGPNGSLFPANRYVVSRGGDRALVLYWFQAHGRAVASQYVSKYYLISDSLRMNRSDGALVRLIIPMYPKESPEAAQARLWNFGSQLIPLLDRYIPR